MNKRGAFTLIEILVSIMLLSFVLLALNRILMTQRASVASIKKHLDKGVKDDKAIMTLYNDLLQSDGNISIKKSSMDSVCINNTLSSIYGADIAKVCWLVLKQDNKLVRVEGVDYRLPLGLEDSVEVDVVAKGIEIFDITRDKQGNVLAVVQESKKEPYSFLLQGIKQPPKPKKKKPKKIIKKPKPQNPDNNTSKPKPPKLPHEPPRLPPGEEGNASLF